MFVLQNVKSNATEVNVELHLPREHKLKNMLNITDYHVFSILCSFQNAPLKKIILHILL
jgi:hypothetical protein